MERSNVRRTTANLRKVLFRMRIAKQKHIDVKKPNAITSLRYSLVKGIKNHPTISTIRNGYRKLAIRFLKMMKFLFDIFWLNE